MIRGLHKQKELAIIDSTFPSKEPRAFRNAEINEYFNKLKNVSAYAMPYMRNDGSWFSHGYGSNKKKYKENLKGYLKYYPENKGRIHFLEKKYIKNIGLAYSFFLAETYTLLPFYEKNAIPFVFVLYPGGAFGLDYEESDRMLSEIFASKYFTKVIVTKPLTRRYLIRKKLCKADKIIQLNGFVQFSENDILPKVLYPEGKQTFDICFVAAKYTEKGIDKGYDIFIKTAKIISRSCRNVRFHIVGGFDENELDISGIKKKIIFYGYQKPDFLLKLYSKMDIFLSPNRAFQLWPGNFDGLLGAEAAYAGVALFITDELNQHTFLKDKKDAVFINHNPSDIAEKITHYYNNVDELYVISENGQNIAKQNFDISEQCEYRIKLFKTLLGDLK